MKAYKVFRRDKNDKLRSLNYSESFCLVYKKGERTEAPGDTKLMVFKTLKRTRLFAIGSGNLPGTASRKEIWEVECGDNLEEVLYLSRTGYSYHSFWWAFNAGRARSGWAETFPAPTGTLACRWVIPIRKMDV